MGFMPNRAIEFHDSTFDGVSHDGADLTLRFSAAYIHQSVASRAWVWVQDALVHVRGGLVEGEIQDLPCDLWDGICG
jgi:hypothetical protein